MRKKSSQFLSHQPDPTRRRELAPSKTMRKTKNHPLQHLSPSVQRLQTSNLPQILSPSIIACPALIPSTNTASRTVVFLTRRTRPTISNISTQAFTTHAPSHLSPHPTARHIGRRSFAIVKPLLPNNAKKSNASAKLNGMKKRKTRILSSVLPTKPRRVARSANNSLMA